MSYSNWDELKARINLALADRWAARNELHEYVLGTPSVALDRDPEKIPLTFLTKPQNVDHLTVLPRRLTKSDLDGQSLEKGKQNPSLNWLVHRACYLADRGRIRAVFHAHIRSIISFASQENIAYEEWFAPQYHPLSMPLVTEEACWALNPNEGLFMLPIVEDINPQGLAKEARRLIPVCNAFAIRNHGIITVGRTIWEALGIALVLKKEAEIILDVMKTGGRPRFRSKESVQHSLSPRIMPPHFRWRSYNQKPY